LSAEETRLTLQTVFVIGFVDGRPDNVTEYLERPFQGPERILRLLAHGDDLHLRFAALGDDYRLAGFSDLVDQGEALRLEGGGIDLAVHGQIPM
jgi:hypothetical protein